MKKLIHGTPNLLAKNMVLLIPNGKHNEYGYIKNIETSNDSVLVTIYKFSSQNKDNKEHVITISSTDNVSFMYPEEYVLEFLYQTKDIYWFFSPDTLEDYAVPLHIIHDCIDLLKTGIVVKGLFIDKQIIDIVISGFWDYMVTDILLESNQLGRNNKIAVLEGGGKIIVPDNIEISDIIKIDTEAKKFLYRV